MYIPCHDCLGVLTFKISLHQLQINIYVNTYSYKYICKYVNTRKYFDIQQNHSSTKCPSSVVI